jgi:hypothetical protein
MAVYCLLGSISCPITKGFCGFLLLQDPKRVEDLGSCNCKFQSLPLPIFLLLNSKCNVAGTWF